MSKNKLKTTTAGGKKEEKTTTTWEDQNSRQHAKKLNKSIPTSDFTKGDIFDTV